MTGREIITAALRGRVSLPHITTSKILFALEDAGYRILAPGDLDPGTLERAASLIDQNMLCDSNTGGEVLHPRTNPGNHVGEAYAAAIRALSGDGQ